MIGERIIKKMIRDRIIDIVTKYVDDPKTQEECIEGITEVAMDMVKIIGIRQIIWYLWYAKKQQTIKSVMRQYGKSNLVTYAAKNAIAVRKIEEAQEKQLVDGSFEFPRMIVCPKCGNKRCPHATDASYECTNSNEPGQEGSRY